LTHSFKFKRARRRRPTDSQVFRSSRALNTLTLGIHPDRHRVLSAYDALHRRGVVRRSFRLTPHRVTRAGTRSQRNIALRNCTRVFPIHCRKIPSPFRRFPVDPFLTGSLCFFPRSFTTCPTAFLTHDIACAPLARVNYHLCRNRCLKYLSHFFPTVFAQPIFNKVWCQLHLKLQPQS